MRLRVAFVAAAALAGSAALLAPSCLSPTEVTLDITTDLPCSPDGGGGSAPQFDRGVQIRVGSAASLAGSAKQPATVTTNCTPGIPGNSTESSIGTFVVTPSDDKNAQFAV